MDLRQEYSEFVAQKNDKRQRNQDYWLLRQAFQGVFRWPTDWSQWIPKLRINLIRRTVLTHASFLMGKGFDIQVQPLDVTEDARKKAQVVEKALYELLEQSGRASVFQRAAQNASLLGMAVLRPYLETPKDGPAKVCIASCQPEYTYPIAKGDDYTSLAKVFYAYTVDRTQAVHLFGPGDYRNEREVDSQMRGEPLGNISTSGNHFILNRKVPVLEIWTDVEYALVVGGLVKYNGPNPYGFIPFEVVQNLDAGDGVEGLSDVADILELNEEVNQIYSLRAYHLKRWMKPTVVWPRAPQGGEDAIRKVVAGGGFIGSPTENVPGFMQPPDPGQNVSEFLDRVRSVIVETAGLNETAFSGQSGASVQTGTALSVSFTNVLSTLGLKQANWSEGLRRLFAKVLELAETNVKEIGVLPDPAAKTSKAEGIRVMGSDIAGHRRVKVLWPGLMPKDDVQAARLELEKVSAGVQSRVSTIEKLGEDFPDDELSRIQEETENPGLNPRDQANMLRAQATQTVAGAKAQQLQAQASAPQEGQEPQEWEPPADMGVASDTPEGFGTTDGGQVLREDGSPVDEPGSNLLRFQARNGRGRRPLPEIPLDDEQTGTEL